MEGSSPYERLSAAGAFLLGKLLKVKRLLLKLCRIQASDMVGIDAHAHFIGLDLAQLFSCAASAKTHFKFNLSLGR